LNARLQRELSRYKKIKRAAQMSEKQLRKDIRIVERVVDALEAAGKPTSPKHIFWIDPYEKIPDDEAIKIMLVTLNWSKWEWSRLNQFLKLAGNPVFEYVGMQFPKKEPVRTWLTKEQASLAFQYCKDDPELLMILGMGILQGLRRHEWMTIKVQDLRVFNANRYMMRVIGKGKMGGKAAFIDIHPDFDKIREIYMDYRDEMIKEKSHGRPIPVPDEVLIQYRKRRFRPYSSVTSMDNKWILIKARLAEHGIYVEGGTHTLRRTFANLMVEAGLPLDYISKQMRHESIATTERYLQKLRVMRENFIENRQIIDIRW
jgi:integrase